MSRLRILFYIFVLVISGRVLGGDLEIIQAYVYCAPESLANGNHDVKIEIIVKNNGLGSTKIPTAPNTQVISRSVDDTPGDILLGYSIRAVDGVLVIPSPSELEITTMLPGEAVSIFYENDIRLPIEGLTLSYGVEPGFYDGRFGVWEGQLYSDKVDYFESCGS